MDLEAINRLIAEKVMGLHMVKETASHTIHLEEVWRTASGHRAYLTKYCTDIAAAWQVAEKFPEMDLIKVMDGSWVCTFKPRMSNSAGMWVGAKTAPLAICLAALKVVGVLIPV